MWILNVHWCCAVLLAGVSAQNAPEVRLTALGRISARLSEPKIKFEDCGRSFVLFINSSFSFLLNLILMGPKYGSEKINYFK